MLLAVAHTAQVWAPTLTPKQVGRLWLMMNVLNGVQLAAACRGNSLHGYLAPPDTVCFNLLWGHAKWGLYGVARPHNAQLHIKFKQDVHMCW